MSETFTFTIVSRKYGQKDVVAPERFRSEIERYRWHVLFQERRATGRQFVVGTHVYFRVAGIRRQKTLYLHRLIRGLAGHEDIQVDHVDGNPLNNAESNLRSATALLNQRNRRQRQCNNTSGAQGISWTDDGGGMWIVRISERGVRRYLGCFHAPLGREAGPTPEAIAAYDRESVRIGGPFAVPTAEVRASS